MKNESLPRQCITWNDNITFELEAIISVDDDKWKNPIGNTYHIWNGIIGWEERQCMTICHSFHLITVNFDGNKKKCTINTNAIWYLVKPLLVNAAIFRHSPELAAQKPSKWLLRRWWQFCNDIIVLIIVISFMIMNFVSTIQFDYNERTSSAHNTARTYNEIYSIY